MNQGTHVSRKVLSTLFYSGWKKLPKLARWTCLDQWSQDDEQAHSKACLLSGEAIKPRPNFSRLSKHRPDNAKQGKQDKRGKK